jgi:hypothetical protein
VCAGKTVLDFLVNSFTCTCALQDDMLIKSEGLDSLTVDELRAACKTRGLKAAYGEGAGTYMRKQMQVGGAVKGAANTDLSVLVFKILSCSTWVQGACTFHAIGAAGAAVLLIVPGTCSIGVPVVLPRPRWSRPGLPHHLLLMPLQQH